MRIVEGDACALDFPDNHFDVVYQSVVFSSILNDNFQQKLAEEMWRMLKSGGGILWYDFTYDNPANSDVRGVSLSRVHELFPQAEITSCRVTLAPPISRFVTKIHPALYHVFNIFPCLRTHVLCWIEKP